MLARLGLGCALVAAGAVGCEPGAPGSGGERAPGDAGAMWSLPGEREPALRDVPGSPPEGLDRALLDRALEEAAALPRLHTLIVARHGTVQAERHFRGPGLDAPANVKSVSKSLLSAIVGAAVDRGHLEGPEQPVAPLLREYLAGAEDPARESITVGHLLSMRSGLQSTSGRNYGRWVASPSWVRHALTRPMVAPPGDRMVYSTGNTHLVSAVLARATGRSTHAFAREHLAEPLGIRLPAWPRDPEGIHFGGNDMLISPRDLLRFGELYRNGGVLDGERVLSREWIEASWRVHARSPRNGNAYGLGWWGRESGGHRVHYAWGYGGQFLFIVPDLELTVVFTSDPVSPREGRHNRALHDLLDDLIVPAAVAGAAEGSPGTAAEAPAGRGPGAG